MKKAFKGLVMRRKETVFREMRTSYRTDKLKLLVPVNDARECKKIFFHTLL